MAQFGANLVYQDFEPFFEWNEDKESVTLTIMLPGFRRDQLKIQVTSKPVLRINGERELTQNLLRRFSNEFPIPSYCDTNNVSAKFERGVLHVKFPKIETPPPPPPPTASNNKPQDQEQTNKNDDDEEQQKEEVAPPIPQQQESPSQEGNTDNDDKEKLHQKEKEDPRTSDEKDEERKESEKEESVQKSVETKKGKEEVHSELSKTTTEKTERKGTRIAQRLKTRMLDFTLSVTDENDVVGKGYVGNYVTGIVKRPKMLMNIVVTVLLIMVLGIYFKNGFWSSSSSSSYEGGSEKLQEF